MELSEFKGKAAVSLSQSQHVWDANQFLHLLKLLKRDISSSKDQFELKSFPQKCVSESKFKFVNKFVQQFSGKNQSPEDTDYEKCFSWACHCVQHLRDQSIAYMSDLRETFQDQDE
jgi:hypothetical protein